MRSLTFAALLVACAPPGPRVPLSTAAAYPTLGPRGLCEVAPYPPGGSPAAGDLVALEHEGVQVVRRVAGVAGESVAVVGGVLQRNGAPVPTRVTREEVACLHGPSPRCACRFHEETVGDRTWLVQTVTPEAAFEDARCLRTEDVAVPIAVPAGHVALISDNRDGAADARAWGPVPVVRLMGRVVRCADR